MRKFLLLYPERRVVDELTIIGWYQDQLADGMFTDPNPMASVDDMIEALQDIGFITVSRREVHD